MYSYFAGERLMLGPVPHGAAAVHGGFLRRHYRPGDGGPRGAALPPTDDGRRRPRTGAGTGRRCRPAGFIFHMSRCGSTLVAQMLAALPENRVLSEPTAINAVIRAALLDARIPRATLVDWLRTVVGLLGCPLEGESRYFVKLDCWHVLALPLIVEAFPETPWIFLIATRRRCCSHKREIRVRGRCRARLSRRSSA